MKKIEYHLNDYVISEDNKICRVVETRLVPYLDFIEEPTQILTLLWRENLPDKSVDRVINVSSNKVIGWSFTRAVLERIGFKKGESATTMVYRDLTERRTIVIDGSDGSIYVFKNSRYIMLDFTFVDYVHDIQHVFEAVGVEFPNLSEWLYLENQKRKPPVKIHAY